MSNDAHICFSNTQSCKLIFRMHFERYSNGFYVTLLLFMFFICFSNIPFIFFAVSSLLTRQLEHRVSVLFGQKWVRDLIASSLCVPKVASASPRSLNVTDWRTVVLMTSLTKWTVSNSILSFSFLLLLPIVTFALMLYMHLSANLEHQD